MHLRFAFLIGLAVFSLGLGAAEAQNAYITNYTDGTVSVVDTANQSVVATIPVAPSNSALSGVTVTADGSKVYVTWSTSSSGTVTGMVSAIDTTTNSVVATIAGVGAGPAGLAVTPDGRKLYVGDIDFSDSNVYVIDTATDTITGTIPVGIQPRGVAVTPDGSKVYVANKISNTVSVIDTATDTVIATVPVGAAPFYLAVTPGGSEVYVGNDEGHSVSVISTATNTVTSTIPVGSAAFPWTAAASPDGSKVYVSDNCVGSGCGLSVISTLTHTVLVTIPLAGNPAGVSVTPDGQFVYVANNGSDFVWVVSTATDTVTNTIAVGNAPIAEGIFIQPFAPAPAFAGIPGQRDCHGQSVAALAQQFGGLDTAATTLGFSSVKALEDGIRAFCGV